MVAVFPLQSTQRWQTHTIDICIKVDIGTQATLEGVVRFIHITAIGKQSGFQALNLVGTACPDLQVVTLAEQLIPEWLSQFKIVQVNFKPTLFAPAGSHDQHFRIQKTEPTTTEELDFSYRRTKHPFHQRVCLRPLDSQRPDIRFKNTDIQAEAVGYAFSPESDIRVCYRQPPAVLLKFYDDRIIHHGTRLIA